MVVGKDEKRSFTIVSVNDKRRGKGEGNAGGRFIAHTPARAASKAGSHICRKTAIRGQCTLHLCIQETTRGSAHKIFHYKIKRRVVNNKVTHDGKLVVYKYATTARKDKTPAEKKTEKPVKKTVKK